MCSPDSAVYPPRPASLRIQVIGAVGIRALFRPFILTNVSTVGLIRGSGGYEKQWSHIATFILQREAATIFYTMNL